jgi:Lactonase, 7-bladed beta-propeller
VTRGNDPSATRPEDPGALKVYGFKNGRLANQESVPPGNGVGFGPRHLDFHPTRPVYDSTNSSIAVFAINPQTGEPNLIQHADAHGAHPRTFSFDPDGHILVSASLVPIAVREGGRVSVLPAGLSVFRISRDGLLDYVRRYAVETGNKTQWWSGLVARI